MALLNYSCGKKNGQEPDLLGKWSDQTVAYYFYEDHTYGQKNLAGSSTLEADSIFGNFFLDKSNKILTFNQSGFYTKTKKLIVSQRNGTAWKYVLHGQSLHYTSNTSIGELIKIQ